MALLNSGAAVRVEGAALAALALLFNAFTWGVSWWPFRHLHAQGVHPLWATALCYLLVSTLLALWRPAALRAAEHVQSLDTTLRAGELRDELFGAAMRAHSLPINTRTSTTTTTRPRPPLGP